MTLEVMKAGVAATVQDLGRPGFGAFGVPEGGAMDRAALASANRLVGNAPGLAGIEFALHGPRLCWRGKGRLDCVVMTGEPRRVTLVPGGDLPSAVVNDRAYGYIAVAGGIAVPRVMGGRGTCLPGGFGGHEGRELRIGDRLLVGMSEGMVRSRGAAVGVAADVVAASARPDQQPRVRSVRVLPGDHPAGRRDQFRALLEGRWQATSGNRVGLRLEGPRLVLEPLHLSQPVPPGAIQVTGAGQPVVLLRDHPTVGGYPVVAVVVTEDLDVIAQARAGDRVNFVRA